MLKVVVTKPSKYDATGDVERFVRGFMPNATIVHIASQVPERIGDVKIVTHMIDEYVQIDLGYLDQLRGSKEEPTLVLLVGVQSHQFQRALDLAALATQLGSMAIIGGPHVMTCDTTMYHGSGVSFSLSESEVVLDAILRDAITHGRLQPVYGAGQRWAKELKPTVLHMPSRADFKRYVKPQLGVYPARGCPFICDFCAITIIAGRNIRSQSIDATIKTLRAAKAAGVKVVFITSDNFNKYHDAKALCEAIIDERLGMKFFVQCDVQIADDAPLLELFARAGVNQIFVGVESINQAVLKSARKNQNKPQKYRLINDMCREFGITANFSLINGFPEDTYRGVLEQLDFIRAIDPGLAWFYTLCPIPGTQQYADFRAAGLITETNLDRFDGTTSTWTHPNLSAKELHELFCRCYREFYTLSRAVRYRPRGAQTTWTSMVNITLFMRYCAARGEHPMSGGLIRRRLDHVREYLPLRLRTYGIERAPLPDVLPLSEAEAEYNRKAKLIA